MSPDTAQTTPGSGASPENLVVSAPMTFSGSEPRNLVYGSITIEPAGTMIFEVETTLTAQSLTVSAGRSENLPAIQVLGANGTNASPPQSVPAGAPGAKGKPSASKNGECTTPAGQGGIGVTGPPGAGGADDNTAGGSAPRVTMNVSGVSGQVTLLVVGGQGGNGGDGGTGGTGGVGGPGGASSASCSAGPQGPGGEGGPGGNGSDGKDGGDGGTVTFLYGQSEPGSGIVPITRSSSGGSGGLPGAGGAGGEGNPNGGPGSAGAPGAPGDPGNRAQVIVEQIG